jgi:hypothetical protein
MSEPHRRYEQMVAAAQADWAARPPFRLKEPPRRKGARLLEVETPPSELELQSRWFAGEFGSEFTTTCGRRVEVVQFGVWNREAGPDFLEAAVRLEEGPVEKGAIELDLQATGWESHGHAVNEAFDGVRLHLFVQEPGATFFTRTSGNRFVPQVKLDLTALSRKSPSPEDPPQAHLGRCAAPLLELGEKRVEDLLHAAARHRLLRKATRLRATAKLHGRHQAVFEGLATALGYRENKLGFTLLAQRFPLKLLRDMPLSAEALLFGAGGFLGHSDLSEFPNDTRTYLRGLWAEWWPHRAACERHMRDMPAWNLGGQRPVNHPQRRLAALSVLAAKWRAFAKLLDAAEPQRIYRFFTEDLEHPYWNHHYTLTSAATEKPMALIGDSRVADMLANIIYPWLLGENPQVWDTYVDLRSKMNNSKLEIAALRLFGNDPATDGPARAKRHLRTLAGQQGLLQVYEDFCLRDCSNCQDCPFPEQLRQW